MGLNEVSKACFVLVAGGLGERLGYPGIKLALPAEIITDSTFFEIYIEHILALQQRVSSPKREAKMPLAIMTSNDTHSETIELPEANKYFGLDASQVSFIKQEKVPWARGCAFAPLRLRTCSKVGR